MTKLEELRLNILDLYDESPQDARCRTFRDSALVCLDAYVESGRMAALSEARACLVKLAALVESPVKDQDESIEVLKDILTR